MSTRVAPRVGLPLILAVTLPWFVLYGAFVGLERLARADQSVADANAGKVLNGSVTRRTDARVRMERMLRESDPRVVVLGNSLANTDLSAAILEAAFDLSTGDVLKLSLPNSIGAHWAAILENRVIDAGFTPDLALIVSDWPSLLSVHPISEASYLALVQQLDDDDPGFDALLGRRWGVLDRIREDRGHLRERIVGAVRRRAVKGITGQTKGVDDALARVFAPDAIDPRLLGSTLPVIDPSLESAIPVFDPVTIPHPSASFVPRLAELSQEADIALVVVRPPMSPRLPSGIGDVVEPTTEASLHGLLRRRGAWDIDLRGLPVVEGDFVNLDHMNVEGADRFTRVVADLVRRVGAWDDDTVVVDWLEPGRLVEGRYRPRPVSAHYASAPPPLRDAERELDDGGVGWGWFELPAWRFLSDVATRQVTPWASRCSPIRVLEDGQPLPRHHETCPAAMRFGRGRTCHDADGIRFTTPDRSDPRRNGRTYQLGLDPARGCERAQWLYPGDELTLRSRSSKRATRLELRIHDQSLRPDPERPAEVDVVVTQGPRTLVTARVAAPGPPTQPATLELREPVLPSTGPVQLVITSQTRAFLMVTEAVLRP